MWISGPPSPPLEVKIVDASREHINITWKAPEKNGGSPITGYHVELSEAGTEKWMRINARPVKELRFKAEEGIIPEKKYVLRVRAINAVGVSDPSEISDGVFAKDPDCKDYLVIHKCMCIYIFIVLLSLYWYLIHLSIF